MVLAAIFSSSTSNAQVSRVLVDVNILRLIILSNGTIQIESDRAPVSSVCTSRFSRLAVNQANVTEDARDMMYSALLAAQFGGSKVRLAMDQNSPIGNGGECYIDRVHDFGLYSIKLRVARPKQTQCATY